MSYATNIRTALLAECRKAPRTRLPYPGNHLLIKRRRGANRARVDRLTRYYDLAFWGPLATRGLY